MKGVIAVHVDDLPVLAAKLRAEGLDARNLGHVGITVWGEDGGVFFPTQELEENADLVAVRDFNAIVAKRNGAGGRRNGN